jgi:sigma-B regulation protein RsbU (phosphoserine phosphatase)
MIASFSLAKGNRTRLTRGRTIDAGACPKGGAGAFFVGITSIFPMRNFHGAAYNASVPDNNGNYMQCMEVWGGSQSTSRNVQMGGLDAWVYSRPFENSKAGGDVYYASSCATGRINRLLLADVSGHGDVVAEIAGRLRTLMRRYVNFLDQTKFVRALNEQFAAMSRQGTFATAVATTFFAPTRTLTVCNAGHPPPLHYSASLRTWSILEAPRDDDAQVRNLPLGVIDVASYEQFHVDLEVGDLVLCYTDALVESRDSKGEMFGPAGLLRIVEDIDGQSTETFIEALLGRISAQYSGNLSEDDVTVMLLRPSGLRPKIRLRQKLRAAARFAAAAVCAINPSAERPPLPDFKLANIAGAIIPPLGKRWRPTCARKADRPTRLSVP